ARTAAGKGQPLIVAEGYMDVIALAEHGFGASVAPLGTAVTEHQLAMLWRIADEPIIALDGDTAGLRAAMRLIDLALPALEAGKSLRFALMPEGQDPDDLLKAQGAGALQKLLDDAIPMVRLLWQRETEGKVFDSPERKAALDKALRDKIKLIQDPSIRQHYGQEIKDLRWDLFRAKRGAAPPTGGRWQGGKGKRGWQAPPTPMPSTKSSALVAGGDQVGVHLREAVILAALITTPDVADEFESGLETLNCADPDHATLRDLILRHAHSGKDVLQENILSALGPQTLDNLMSSRHVALIPCIRTPGDSDMARMTVAEELAKLSAAKGLDAEIADAMQDLEGVADEGVTWRLGQAAAAADNATRTGKEDNAEYDVSANGARISKSERDAFASLMDQISFSKPRR
ncbi:MAG: toprim domain-containing protein, partial [Pseudomonadota bacterium]